MACYVWLDYLFLRWMFVCWVVRPGGYCFVVCFVLIGCVLLLKFALLVDDFVLYRCGGWVCGYLWWCEFARLWVSCCGVLMCLVSSGCGLVLLCLCVVVWVFCLCLFVLCDLLDCFGLFCVGLTLFGILVCVCAFGLVFGGV